jgi:dihydroorotate dehydrogenase electron transfer subunit
VAWAECICIAGDMARYPALARLVQEVRFHPQPRFAQALVRVPMPCGVGVCDICRVTTRHGERRACVDGPVFDLMDYLA